ncbi:MAG TPA: hypothetical protein VFI99_07590 [Nocardioides sp.]|nr:hypothetical protein [Nocardioides sp.]
MPRPSLLLVALVLLLGGCQSEDADPADRPTPDPAQIRAALADLFAGDHPGTRETAEGDCFAEKLTEAVSPHEMRSAGVLDASYDVVTHPPPLPEDVAGEWADAQLTCSDFVEASTRAQVKVTHGDLDGKVYASCLRARMTPARIRAAVRSSLMGNFDDAAVADLSEAQTVCAQRAKP